MNTLVRVGSAATVRTMSPATSSSTPNRIVWPSCGWLGFPAWRPDPRTRSSGAPRGNGLRVDLIWNTGVQVLHCRHDVVLDWNQWNRERRARWRDRARQAGYGAVLHHIDVSVESVVALALARSGTEPAWSHRIEPDAVRHLASIFEPPTAEEGIPIRTIGTSNNGDR